MSKGLNSVIRRIIDDGELVIFTITVIIVFAVVYWFAVNLPALIVAVLLAYLLNSIINQLIHFNVPRLFAITSTLVVCLLSLAYLMLVGFPLITGQLSSLITQLPKTIPEFQNWLDVHIKSWNLPESFDSKTIIEPAREWIAAFGENALASTLANVVNLFNIVVYIVLIPLLLFFTLRDKEIIFRWLNKFLPTSDMMADLRSALDEQFGAYVRGKMIEGFIVFIFSLIGFLILEVDYALVLAVAIGLSVIIPFVGAIAVTVPVVAVGLAQFGTSADFWWMIGIYAVVQIFDGQVLVPILFSEVVKIHPVAILVAILFFGAIWGMWGVFFAIPLASLIKSIIAVIERRIATHHQQPNLV